MESSLGSQRSSRTTWLCLALAAAWISGCAGPTVSAQDIRSGNLLADDFGRFGTATSELGTVGTSTVRWGKRDAGADGAPLPNLVLGVEGALHIRYHSGQNNAPGVFLEGVAHADAVISVTVGRSLMKGRTHRAIVTYRAASDDDLGPHGPKAYHVELAGDWSGSRDVLLRYGKQVVAVGDVAETRTEDDVHRVKVAFAGYHHQVEVDGKRVIDYWEHEAGRNGPGQIGFGQYYSQGVWDDFELAAAVSDGSRPPTDTASGRIAPLLYQGRPLFVLGTFDQPRTEDLAEWKEAGCNAVIVSCFRGSAPGPENEARLRDLTQWGADHDVAMVYYPLINFFSKDGDRTIPTRQEEIPAKRELIEAVLAVTADHPNTLGYWTFDEIENHLYKAYGEWEAKKDKGLAAWIADSMKWTYDALKAGDPDAYVMPTIAWWTTYEGLAPLYDVNVPNTYPCGTDEAHLQADLYTVVYDAVKAADAIRATGRTSFVFMPPTFDIIDGYRPASLPELRYCYLAPVTQGAMGILPWRLGRCSMPYRRAVVYPVMREVKRLIPWLLGEWHDDKVRSNRDTATAEYLKEFPERIKLLPGEEDAETVEAEVDAVPDCSHCLRRRPDNNYLLLCVNNRREPLDVTFTIKGIPGMPDRAREMIAWYEVPIANGTITEALEPFAVKAYTFTPE